MSGYNNNFSDDYDLEGDGQRGGGGLRRLLEETLAENKKLREAFEGKEREKSTTALLKEKGLDPAFADLIPANEDPAEWLTKHGRLLGVKDASQNDEQVQTQPDIKVASDDDPAVIAQREALAREQKALADMQNAAESGLSAEVSQDLINQMDKIDSEDALIKFFKEHGAPEQD